MVFGIALCSCNEQPKTNKHTLNNQAVSQTAIVGDWTLDGMYAGIDTLNIPDVPDIKLETNISFYNNGQYKKHDAYYTIKNHREKAPGYTSNYRLNGDTLFLYEPMVKHWYALYLKISSKNKMEIGSRKGYSHLDIHYYFSKARKQ